MAGTLVKRVLLQITADDMDAEAKLEAISAKADELAAKNPELKVKIDTAAAAAKMRVLRDELKTAAAPVEVPVELETTEAQVKAAGLLAQLDEARAAAGDIRVKADDRQAQATILSLKAKLADLAEKTADPKIKISGVAHAEADIAAVRLQLDKLKAKEDELSLKADAEAAKGGILARFLGGSKAFGGGFGGVLSIIPGLGGLAGLGGSGASDAGGAAGAAGDSGPAGAAGVGAAISALVAAAPAIAAELTGIVSGFAAAGAGAGAFALLAYPAFSKVSTATQQINADQQTYNRALTATARNTALQHLRQDYAALDPAQRATVEGIQQLTGEWHKMSTAFEPQAFKVFSGVLQLANQLLPAVTPFAQTFANAISGLLKDASKFAGSSGFKDWLAQFQKLEGPSITAIGTGVGHLVTSFGKLLTVMSAKDVVNALNIAFSVLDGTIIGFTRFVQGAMITWDALTTAYRFGEGVIRTAGHSIASVFDAVRRAAADMGHGMAIWFDTERHDVASLAATIGRYLGNVVSFFRRLPGEIVGAVGNLGSLLFQAGRNVIQGLINGIESMIGSVGSAMGGILGKVRNFLPFSPAREGPLSGSGSPDIAGRKIGLMLASGMEQSTSAVAASNARLARAAGIGVHGTAAGGYGAAGGTARLQLEWVGGSADQALITLLKQHIRIRGGNPSVLGA